MSINTLHKGDDDDDDINNNMLLYEVHDADHSPLSSADFDE